MIAHASRRFNEASTLTQSPAQLVVMCFERIDRDLEAMIDALNSGDLAAAHEQCCHAQDIITELMSSVDESRWEHAGQLVSLYSWSIRELVDANMRKDGKRVVNVRTNLNALGEAFRTALGADLGTAS